MGQSKLKRRAHEKILAGNPGCIYCAGSNVAVTIEHMPAISMFEGRQRPKGLEFPACAACNNGTGDSDLVAAMLARTWPDAKSEVQQKDVRKIFGGLANNIPGLFNEMNIGRASEKLARKRHNLSTDVHPLRADGPILNHHILTFAAKPGAPWSCGFQTFRQWKAKFQAHFSICFHPPQPCNKVRKAWPISSSIHMRQASVTTCFTSPPSTIRLRSVGSRLWTEVSFWRNRKIVSRSSCPEVLEGCDTNRLRESS
jgi:hypothetical protein